MGGQTGIEHLLAECRRLRQGILADNTRLGYGYDWRMFADWCRRFKRESLPATPETVSLYLADLLEQGKKITTARRRKCAIAHEHRAHGLASPVSREILDLLVGAQRIRGEKPRQMQPLTVRELRAISAKLAKLGTDTAIRNRALMVLGFASALRRSNLAALTTEDVEFRREGLIVCVEREKNDQEGHGRFIGVPRANHPNTDAAGCLRAWLGRRGRAFGPLFWRLDPKGYGLPLDGDAITKIVKQSVALIGLDPTDYGSHSMRAGFITECGERQVGELLIMAQSGHRSVHMLRRYFRRSRLFKSNAAGLVGL